MDEGRAISVKDALVGINQLIDEDANKATNPPPVTAEPITRQFLRIFQGKTELARDQMQKLLRGSGIAPDEFTNRGWASEQKKVFHLIDPLEFRAGLAGAPQASTYRGPGSSTCLDRRLLRWQRHQCFRHAEE